MKDYFSYNPGTDIIPADHFRISPSQLSKFFDTTSQWYHEHLMGEAPAFLGNTASELGNCVHAAAEMYFDTKTVDKQALLDYIDSITNPEVDKSIIKAQLKPMIDTLINNFLANIKPTHAELFVHHEILPGIHVGGSVDLYDANSATLYDYKTMGSLDSARVPSSFPRSYYFQQLTYAYTLRQMGYTVNTMKLVYISRDNTGRISEKTGKAMKDYPSEVNIVTHVITDQDIDLIHGVLKVVAHSVKHWQENPEHRYLLAQDFRLYKKPAPILFKD
jgi:hypothetical protein